MDNLSFPSPLQDYKVLCYCITYNQAQFIEDTMNGFIMQQTDFPFVCTIIDDASTDGEQDVIKAFLNSHFDMADATNYDIETSIITVATAIDNANCTFAVFFLKQNLWKNQELKNAHIQPWLDRCEFEALCEGDDFWTDPLKLQKQVDFLENNPEYGVAYSSYQTVDFSGQDVVYPPSKEYLSRSISGDIFLELLKGNFPQTLTVIYRRDTFDLSLRPPYVYDYTTFLNLSLRTKFYFFPEKFGCYRINPNGAMLTNALEGVDTVRIQLFYLNEYFQHKEYRRPRAEDRKIVSFMVECCCGFHYYIKYKDLFWAIIKSRPFLVFKLPQGLFEARKRRMRSLGKNQ